MQPVEVQPLLLFDGVCNLCSASVQFVLSHEREKRLSFCSLQSELGVSVLKKYGIDREVTDSLVLVMEDKAYVKSEAVLHLSQFLKSPYRLAYGMRWLPLSLRNGIYDWIARNRYRMFGKKDECWLPSPELRRRFLD